MSATLVGDLWCRYFERLQYFPALTELDVILRGTRVSIDGLWALRFALGMHLVNLRIDISRTQINVGQARIFAEQMWNDHRDLNLQTFLMILPNNQEFRKTTQ